MKPGISRRDFARLLASGASAAALAGSARTAFADTRLRLQWWGNPDRDKRTFAVVDLYKKKNPGVTVDAETYGWTDYWPKLATEAAGKNLPDVIQMDYRYIFEYARRGQIADLGAFSGDIHLDNFDKTLLATGMVDGKLYGVPMGANSYGLVYDKETLDQMGVKLPDQTKWTWDDFRKLGMDLKGKLASGLTLTSSMGGWEPALEIFVRQRGKDLYTPDGQLGYDATDIGDYWNYWLGLQKDGLTPPPDVQMGDVTANQKQMIVTGNALFDYAGSNQLVVFQNLVKHKLDMAMLPNQAGNKPGQYMKPAMLISQSASTPAPGDAAKFINFLITDLDAAEILQIERGVPGDAKVLERVKQKLSDVEKLSLAYLAVVSTHVGPIPPPPPLGAGEMERALPTTWQSIAFGKAAIKDAVNDYIATAKRALKPA